MRGLGLLHGSFYGHYSSYSQRERAEKGEEININKSTLCSAGLLVCSAKNTLFTFHPYKPVRWSYQLLDGEFETQEK